MTTSTTTIRISEELKTELSSLGSKEDTYEDIIQRNIQFAKKFSNEKQFAEWFEVNFRLLGFDQIIEKPAKCPDYIMLKGTSKVRVELETMSGNFILHRHDPNDVDLVICLLKNKELPVQTIELSAFDYIPPTPPETNKSKISIDIPDDLYYKVKEYNFIHKGRPINMSGMFQECIERILNKEQNHKPEQLEPEIIKSTEPIPEIIIESSLSLEAMRDKWYKEKQIGISIVKAGGIGVINLTNIIQKNPDLFETKEECRTWLHNKLKTEPPVIEEIETIKTPNKTHKLPPSNTVEAQLKFTPRRSTIKCPGCGEEQLELPGSPVRKCTNCGFNFNQEDSTKQQPDQIAAAQDTPTPPPEPEETK